MKKYLKLIIIGVILAGLIVGYYFYLSNRQKESTEEKKAETTVVQNLLLTNLNSDYPPTPKEVCKLYADITCAFYSDDYTEEEFEALALKMRELYDEELLAANDETTYINNLKAEVTAMQDSGVKVSSYATSSSTDVEYFDHNGYKCARLNVAFTLKDEAKAAVLSKETFVLRKDSDGHWKIYGWAMAKDDDE